METQDLTIYSDGQLMLLYHHGVEEAFTRLYERHHRRVHTVLLRMSGNEFEAQDLLQEVFCRVARAAARYEPRARFETWLHRIALNLFLDHRRSVVRLNVVPLPDPEPVATGEGPEQVSSDRDLERRFRAEVAALPETLRAAFVLREIAGFSEHEAAEMLEIPRGTVKTHVHRARLHLRDRVGRSLDFPLRRRSDERV